GGSTMGISMTQSLIDGLLMGGVYALAALGVSLIFGVMKITNFAHGALITVGMFIAYLIFSTLGISPYASLPVTIIVMFLIGYGLQRITINPIINAPSHNQLLLTQGISIVLENLLLVIFTANYKSVLLPGFDKAIRLGAFSINKPKLIAFGLVVVASLGVYLLLQKTDVGHAISATSVQREGATLMGIKVEKINAVAFGIGVACAGVAGALLAPIQYISPTVGGGFQLKCFVIAVFGGLGNIWGAVVAGLIIGVVESLAALLLGGSWSEMVIYLIFILVLLFKPTGLFGKKTR
ncbi:MAG: branched-chain amino acid ABC transporter permease, partial [Lachnospiraceae bacterium]|nr:branched-chain amino acid ABC transporter permease [Lachnospiraceae bacterium]